MKNRQHTLIEWFLRISLSAGFLSAVADRFGFWPKELSPWGNWSNFLVYTKDINPYLPDSFIPFVGGAATALEIIFGIALLTKYKAVFFARCAGILLLLFALSMTFSKSIKAPLDYSVFSASAAAFALSWMIAIKLKANESTKDIHCDRQHCSAMIK